LLFNYLKLKTAKDRKGYCTFINLFLKMMMSHQEINDTTTREAEDLRILYELDKQSTKQKALAEEETMLKNAFRFLGFTRNSETDDIEVDPEVATSKTGKGEDEPGLSSNKAGFKGEGEAEDEHPIDDQY
jgi:hypothetical protein